MNNPKVSVPATIAKITTMADRSLRLEVDTQEITDPEVKRTIFEMHDKLGYFFFNESEIRQIDTSKLPEVAPIEKGEKTPSERLRAVLYVWHEQQKLTEPFDTFYRRTIEKYIQQIKEKLA